MDSRKPIAADPGAVLGVDDEGRREAWSERLEQDEPLMDLVRSWAPPADGLPWAGAMHEPPSPRLVPADSHAVRHSRPFPGARSAQDRLEESLATIQATAQDNAFISVWPHEARARARALDERARAGETMGPLYGAVVAVKDIMQVRGRALTGGTRALRTTPAERDAEAVRRLLEADAVLVGVTNLHALAYGPFSTSSDAGVVANPWCREVVAGGSSGGSAAAVASGASDLTLGTDTAGSVRIPSALCGVVGLKGTFGAAPMSGVHPLAPSLDHVGPIAATVAGVAAGWRALRGQRTPPDSGAPAPHADVRLCLHDVVVGDPGPALRQGLDPLVRGSWDSALETARRCGARVQPVDIPDLHRVPGVMLCTIGPEAAEVHRGLLRQRGSLLPEDVRLRLEAGAFIAAVDYLRAQQLRAHLRRQVDAALEGIDVLLLPTLPVRAPRRDAVNASAGGGTAAPRAAMSRFTALANLTGHPALTLPWAHDPDGAGMGVQLIGPWSGEEALLHIAAGLERARES